MRRARNLEPPDGSSSNPLRLFRATREPGERPDPSVVDHRRDPSVVNAALARLVRGGDPVAVKLVPSVVSAVPPRDHTQGTMPHIELSDRQMELMKRRQGSDQEVVDKASASTTTSKSSSSHADLHDQQRAFLRSLLTKQTQHQKPKSNQNKSNLSSAKQRLLRNVLEKTHKTPRKEEAAIPKEDVRQKWKRAAGVHLSISQSGSTSDTESQNVKPTGAERLTCAGKDAQSKKPEDPVEQRQIEQTSGNQGPRVELTELPKDGVLTNENRPKSMGLIRQRYEATLRKKTFQEQAKTNEEKRSAKESEFELGFLTFVDVLQKEVRGQHSQLWESFHAVMTNRSSKLEVLAKPEKTLRFDAATRQIVIQLNQFLKHQGLSQHLGVTQLVNDKKLRQAVMNGEAKVGQFPTSRKVKCEGAQSKKSDQETPRSIVEHHERYVTNIRPADTKASHKDRNNADSTKAEDIKRRDKNYQEEKPFDEVDTSFRDDQRYAVMEDSSSEHASSSVRSMIMKLRSKSDESLKRSSPDAIIQTRSMSSHSISPRLSLHRNMRALTDDVVSLEDDDDMERNSLITCETKMSHPSPAQTQVQSDFEANSDAGMEITLTQYESKMLPPDKQPGSDSTRWQDIQLRPVASEEGSVSTGRGSSHPQFASVRLRPVSKSYSPSSKASQESNMSMVYSVSISEEGNVVTGNQSYTTDTPSFQTEERLSPRKNIEHRTLHDSLSLAASVDSTSGKSLSECTNYEDTSTSNDIQNLTGSCETASTGGTEQSRIRADSVTISLVPETEGISSSVIIGKQMIVKVKEPHGQTEASVVWTLPRSQVHSLTLDMANQRVILLLIQEGKTKSLSFPTSKDCLQFTNAFYELSPEPKSSSEAVKTNTEMVTASACDDEDNDDDASLLGTLNEEEQKVLETYRRLRKTKTSSDALQESVASEVALQTASSALTNDEDEIAERYRAMLRMSFPLPVVKHKMNRDGVSEKIKALIASEATLKPPEFVSAHELPSSPISTFSSSCGHSLVDGHMSEKSKGVHTILNTIGETSILTPDEDQIAERYRKMLKMTIPVDAVRHKMKMEQVPANIVDVVLGAKVKEASSSATDNHSESDKAMIQKYKKMLTMGIELDAVHHRMLKEGAGSHIIDAVTKSASSVESGNAKVAEADVARKVGTVRNALSDDEESIASQYRKMLKLQIPKEKVFTKMKQEGVSEKIIKVVLGSSVAATFSDENEKDQNGQGSNLVSLHWTPLSGKELDESVWSIASRKRKDEVVKSAGNEIDKLIQLFQKKTKSSGVDANRKKDPQSSGSRAKLLDVTRSNNISISLKAFKEFSFQELSEIIAYVDPLRKVRGERAQFIRDLLPTPSEIKAIQEYPGSEDKLEPAELWFKHIADVKRLETKAEVLRTMEMFNSEAKMLKCSFELLNDVSQQVIHSEKLQDVLEMVLCVGNIMNEGTKTGGASGFKFDSLLRLTQTKSSDGNCTVLDFLVNLFVSKGRRDVLELASDFPDCHRASRMVISDLVQEVKDLGESLERCKSELEALMKDATTKTSSSGAPPVAARNSLPTAILNHPSVSGQTCLQAPRHIPNSSQLMPSSLFCSTKSTEEIPANNIHGGIDRLRRFLAIETETYADLLQQRNDALDSCKDMAKYCGESSGIGAVSPLLSVLSQFASNLEAALKKHDELKEASSRSQRQKDKGISSDSSVNTISTGKTEANEAKKSLVLMVNELLRDANEQTKEDYRKGRVYHNPTNRLKEIYEREHRLGSSTEAEKRDIVSTIQHREAKVDTEDFRQAHSKFARVSPSSESKNPNVEGINGIQQNLFKTNDEPSKSDSRQAHSKFARVSPTSEIHHDNAKVISCVQQELLKTNVEKGGRDINNPTDISNRSSPSKSETSQKIPKSVADAVKRFSKNQGSIPIPFQPSFQSPVKSTDGLSRSQVFKAKSSTEQNDQDKKQAKEVFIAGVNNPTALDDSDCAPKVLSGNDPKKQNANVALDQIKMGEHGIMDKDEGAAIGQTENHMFGSDPSLARISGSSTQKFDEKHDMLEKAFPMSSSSSSSSYPIRDVTGSPQDVSTLGTIESDLCHTDNGRFDLSGSEARLSLGGLVIGSSHDTPAVFTGKSAPDNDQGSKENSLLIDLARRMSTDRKTSTLKTTQETVLEKKTCSSEKLQVKDGNSPSISNPTDTVLTESSKDNSKSLELRKGESTVARMARLKRESKRTKADDNQKHQSPIKVKEVTSSNPRVTVSSETDLARLAREMRKAKKISTQ